MKRLETAVIQNKESVAIKINELTTLSLSKDSSTAQLREGVQATYDAGYAKGYADGLNRTGNIVYQYHTHGDGHCVMDKPIYHSHTNSCLQWVPCPGTLYPTSSEHLGGYPTVCSYCGRGSVNNAGFSCGGHLGTHVQMISCGLDNSIIGYDCSLLNGQILSATITF